MNELLLIDDEKDLLETFEAYFTLKGYQVYTAANTQDGRVQLLLNEVTYFVGRFDFLHWRPATDVWVTKELVSS